MKLVEVVVLLGAHCASPVQQMPVMTEASKVQCAVIVEKDTATGTVRVMPEGAAAEPRVATVVDRYKAPAAVATAAGAAAATPPAPLLPPSVTAAIAPPPHLPGMGEASAAPGPVAAPLPPAPPPRIVPAWAPPETATPQTVRKPLRGPGLAAAPSGTDTTEAADPKAASAEDPKDTVTAPPTKARKATAKRAAARKEAQSPVQQKIRKAKAAEKTPAKRKQAQAKRAAQCSAASQPQWYKTADGKRKYRCVSPTLY